MTNKFNINFNEIDKKSTSLLLTAASISFIQSGFDPFDFGRDNSCEDTFFAIRGIESDMEIVQ